MGNMATAIRLPVERAAPDTIRLERLLDAPVETVWRYLTDAELRSSWFMGGTDATGVGEFELLVDHDRRRPLSGGLCRVQRRALDRDGQPVRAAAPARDDLPGRQERDRDLRA